MNFKWHELEIVSGSIGEWIILDIVHILEPTSEWKHTEQLDAFCAGEYWADHWADC